MVIDKELKDFLEKEGYHDVTYIEGKGVCGILPFIFTVGLCTNLTMDSMGDRYCYAHKDSVYCVLAMAKWKAESKKGSVTKDPDDIYWIKRKGKQEYNNPNYYGTKRTKV